uniref:Large ribosomal subunit protein mL49 n=1 Tax=Heterosigma akashiwo TaxID=2829 RepID=A0A7S3XRT8_HETAK
MERISSISRMAGGLIPAIRKHSRNQVKRLFKKNPVALRHRTKYFGKQVPPEKVAEIPTELQFKPSQEPKALPNGWTPPPATVPDGYPFTVTRTLKGKWLPVYTDIRNGRTKTFTIVRRIEGDPEPLRRDLSALTGARAVARAGRVEVPGNHVPRVRAWLAGLGF